MPGLSLFLDIISLLEDRVLHKEAWVAKLIGTHLHKKVKFSWRGNSPLALKGLKGKKELRTDSGLTNI